MKKKDLLLEQWKMAAELHQREDQLLWQRFSYFVALNGILISGLGAVLTAKNATPNKQHLFLLVVSMFGSIVSLAFSSIFRRAYYYHVYRIDQADKAEEALKIRGERVLTVYIEGIDQKKVKANRFVWCFARPFTGNVVFALTLFIAVVWLSASVCGAGLLGFANWAISLVIGLLLFFVLVMMDKEIHAVIEGVKASAKTVIRKHKLVALAVAVLVIMLLIVVRLVL